MKFETDSGEYSHLGSLKKNQIDRMAESRGPELGNTRFSTDTTMTICFQMSNFVKEVIFF